MLFMEWGDAPSEPQKRASALAGVGAGAWAPGGKRGAPRTPVEQYRARLRRKARIGDGEGTLGME